MSDENKKRRRRFLIDYHEAEEGFQDLTFQVIGIDIVHCFESRSGNDYWQRFAI